ncbi:MAG: hypothetical protein R6U44_01705 [Archaeoglobaceae archaeon]
MRYLKIKINEDVKPTEIAGVDGITYKITNGEIVTLPYLNAKILLDNGCAELIGHTQEVEI